MGLLTSISNMRLGLQGKTPNVMPSALPSSKLHNTYSINGTPSLNRGIPSLLDLDGLTPSKYLDNPPS